MGSFPPSPLILRHFVAGTKCALTRLEASSYKLQATSYKLQATSHKRLRHFGEFIKDKNMLVYGINQPGEKTC
jgi:hypothetical protein